MQYTDDQPTGKDKLRCQRFEHEDGRGEETHLCFPRWKMWMQQRGKNTITLKMHVK